MGATFYQWSPKQTNKDNRERFEKLNPGKAVKKVERELTNNDRFTDEGRTYVTRVQWEERKETGPYRSMLLIGYDSQSEDVEYRIWVHTAEKEITSRELNSRMQKMLHAIPPQSNIPMEELQSELNVEIEEQEIVPNDATLGTYYGFASYEAGGKYYNYYVEDIGGTNQDTRSIDSERPSGVEWSP